MTKPDYDDPDVEERWCCEQQKIVADYLRSQKVKHGRIGEWPAWHVAPYASIWAIESLARPECIGWWVICGDLPTDYISSADVEPPQHPRKAMRVFAQNWLEVVNAWKDGQDIEYVGAGGTVDFDDNGDVKTPIAIWKFTEDGTETVQIVPAENIPSA